MHLSGRVAPWYLSALFALTLSGCNGSHVSPAVSGSAFQGKVFGGQQPITGATVQLYAVGTTADGAPSTALLTTAVTTSDGSGVINANANTGNANNTLAPGYFNITGDYTCPVGDALVFLTASGGNPGLTAGTNNTSIQQIAAIGSCTNLQTNVRFLAVNELTTVGAVAALYPYMTAYNAIGSTPAHASALTSAFNLANEYVNFQNGQSPGPALPAGYNASTNDLNALANVTASCVNTTGGAYNDGSACGNLYFYAKAPGASTNPADTVAALLSIRNNPTHNVTTIFNLQPPSSPFQPVNASAPPDFTLPILPQPGTPAISLASGTYNGAQTVTITDTDATAVIYYTTDGSTPSTASTVYSGAVTVSASETLKAIAVESSRAFSPVASAAYIINGATVTPTFTVSTVTAPFGSTNPAVVTAIESGSAGVASGNVVTFSVTGTATGTFNPASCVISNGRCSASYIPTGALAAGTYTGDITASSTANGSYGAATATGDLVINNAPTFTSAALALLSGTDTSGNAGSAPTYGNLIQASDGFLYGSTSTGGASDNGTVFKVSLAGVYTVLHSFSAYVDATSAGSRPYGALVQGRDGFFYGVTQSGGSANAGSIFKISSDGTAFTTLYSFTYTGGDGGYPYSGLIQGSDGLFYGTTANGGANSFGTVYTITSSGTYNVIYSFAGGTTDGARPYAPLLQGSDGNFYGTTNSGGANSGGTVFRLNLGTIVTDTVIYSFATATVDGKAPYAGLVQGSDGNFYGATVNGIINGTSNSSGAAFSINPAGTTYTVLHSFTTASADGRQPYAGLFLGSDGTFYGTTYAGGPTYGIAYSLTASGTFTQLRSYLSSGGEGNRPKYGLVQASNGVFYGATTTGGASGSYGAITSLTASPALPPPVVLTVPSTVTHGTSFTLGYAAANAYSTTLQQCFATNTAGDTTGWTGIKTGNPIVTNATLTAPATAGTYTYTLTCGGTESGFATLNVQ